MKTNHTSKRTMRPRGFTLLEMIISLGILLAVIAVVIQSLETMEQRKANETTKIDLVQESREFMDQITNDIHQSGFPGTRMFDYTVLPPTPCPAFLLPQVYVGAPVNGNPGAANACPPNVAAGVGGNGLNSITATSIQFEADVDGTGVSEVFIQLVQTNGANAAPCNAPPCVIQRGTISKTAWLAGQAPLYYTELNSVMNTAIFAAYDNTGAQVALPATTQGSLATVTDVGITLLVRGLTPDGKTGIYPTATMISDAKVRLN